MGGLFKGSTRTQDPWVKSDRAAANDVLAQIQGLGSAAAEYGQPTAYENQAGDILSSYNPESWLGGVKGYLGQGQGALDQALGAISGQGPLGTSLRDTITGKNLDVTGGAYAARNAAISSEMQRLLNQNLDTLAAGSQRATGGVGAGSAGVETQRRAITEAGSQLGETLAQLSAADLARERGFQETATSGAMGLLPGIASGYQGLGSILGQAGTAAGNLSLNQAGALGTLGGTLAAREYAGVTSPIDYLLNYLATARGTAVQTPSAFGQLMGALGSGLGGAGQAMGGAAALMAASDRRVKILHGSGEDKLRKFLSELSAYQYTYVPSMGLGSDKHIGVMAQDMEKSEVGRAFVKTREDGVKFIDYGLALNTMMAAVAMLNRKVEELEARDAGKS